MVQGELGLFRAGVWREGLRRHDTTPGLGTRDCPFTAADGGAEGKAESGPRPIPQVDAGHRGVAPRRAAGRPALPAPDAQPGTLGIRGVPVPRPAAAEDGVHAGGNGPQTAQETGVATAALGYVHEFPRGRSEEGRGAIGGGPRFGPGCRFWGWECCVHGARPPRRGLVHPAAWQRRSLAQARWLKPEHLLPWPSALQALVSRCCSSCVASTPSCEEAKEVFFPQRRASPRPAGRGCCCAERPAAGSKTPLTPLTLVPAAGTLPPPSWRPRGIGTSGRCSCCPCCLPQSTPRAPCLAWPASSGVFWGCAEQGREGGTVLLRCELPEGRGIPRRRRMRVARTPAPLPSGEAAGLAGDACCSAASPASWPRCCC